MNNESRRKLSGLQDKMTDGARRGFEMVLNKIDAIESRMAAMEKRQETSEKTNTEILRLVNAINDKIKTEHIEEKAAVLTAGQKFVGTKFGKIVLMVLFFSGGLALAYIIEHGALTAITGMVK